MRKHILPAVVAAIITVLVGSAALIPQQANADIICKLDIVPQEFKDDYNFFVTDDWHSSPTPDPITEQKNKG